MEKTYTVFVDLDHAFMMGYNKKILNPFIIVKVKELYREGMNLFCWSKEGSAQAKSNAENLGLSHCFKSFLPKPSMMIDGNETEKNAFSIENLGFKKVGNYHQI